jgi:hypothetical protein
MYWRGEEVFQAFRAGFAQRVAAAAGHLVAKMKEKTGIQGPPPSLPGNPPHMDSTELNATIGFELRVEETSIEACVGSPAPQAGWMELGTQPHESRGTAGPGSSQKKSAGHPGVAPRPWCLSTLVEEKETTRAIIAEGADTSANTTG